ncbi:MAG: DUF4945 domain-containing protein [Flavihumibacter sp.]
MKNSVIILLVVLLLSACNTKETIRPKRDLFLPGVENLVLNKGTDNMASLSWSMPKTVPSEIQQPLNVLIEVKETIGLKTNTVASVMLPDAPTSFEAAVPNPEKTYTITVKVNGQLINPDPNYSSNIYSLGQTVQYN